MPYSVDCPFERAEPFVRFAGAVPITPDRDCDPIAAYDHRVFAPSRGTAVVNACDTAWTLGPDDALYLPAGTPYTLLPADSEPLEVIAINFDFTCANADRREVLRLVRPDQFELERLHETVAFPDAPVFAEPLYLRGVPELRPYLEAMVYESAAAESLFERQLSCLATVALNLMRRSANARQSVRENGSYRRILAYIQEHCAEPLSNAALGEAFSYHPGYVSRIVQAQTGCSLHRYLLRIRIRKATQLLLATQLPVGEVAERCGFQNVSYFSQYYRKVTGQTPTDVRAGAEV